MKSIFTKKQKKILIAVSFISVLFLSLAYISSPSGALEVHFLDVGQGDSVFIQSPSKRQILVDGGPPNSSVLEKLGDYMPFYDRSIDLVVATHMDADHIGGLLDVLDRFSVSTILVGSTNTEGDLAKRFFKKANQKGVRVVTVSAGDRFWVDTDVYFDVIWPAGVYQNLSTNEMSVVLKLVHKEDSFLLTGDIERFAEYKIAQSGASLEADVLKVAHHGSDTSSVKYFLDRVSAKIAAVQVGENYYGHPHPDVLNRLRNAGSIILRNDLNGVISIYSYGQTF